MSWNIESIVTYNQWWRDYLTLGNMLQIYISSQLKYNHLHKYEEVIGKFDAHSFKKYRI